MPATRFVRATRADSPTVSFFFHARNQHFGNVNRPYRVFLSPDKRRYCEITGLTCCPSYQTRIQNEPRKRSTQTEPPRSLLIVLFHFLQSYFIHIYPKTQVENISIVFLCLALSVVYELRTSSVSIAKELATVKLFYVLPRGNCASCDVNRTFFLLILVIVTYNTIMKKQDKNNSKIMLNF
ncbi:uncharacterized protein LOC143177368 [Calliopsis andreniformis]|uniref:uncharacterized protein LOC143177368 n=1 Tax=Calliopsis andreniformis TaxID=337506 RepID=UPI003FCD6749